MKKERPFRETALMRLGAQVSRYAGPVAAQDGYNDDDITERMAQADDDRLAPAWVEVVDRILKLERRVPQSHRTRSSLKWLRRWEVWIGEEMHRREAVPRASVVMDPWCTCDIPTRPFCGCGQCGECAGARPPPICDVCNGRADWS